MPYWTGSAWQGGEELPSPDLGWVTLYADGGHPGDARHSPVRRWVAPAAGTVRLTGKLSHGSDNGDGVCAHIVSDRLGLIAEWVAFNNQLDTAVEGIEVQAGDSLDLVVDCRNSVTSDSFAWEVALTLTSAEGQQQNWSSRTDFHGPRTALPPLPQQIVYAWQLAYGRPPTEAELSTALSFVVEQFRALIAGSSASSDVDPSLQVMENLCQVLMSSNEFLYVD